MRTRCRKLKWKDGVSCDDSCDEMIRFWVWKGTMNRMPWLPKAAKLNQGKG